MWKNFLKTVYSKYQLSSEYKEPNKAIKINQNKLFKIQVGVNNSGNIPKFYHFLFLMVCVSWVSLIITLDIVCLYQLILRSVEFCFPNCVYCCKVFSLTVCEHLHWLEGQKRKDNLVNVYYLIFLQKYKLI